MAREWRMLRQSERRRSQDQLTAMANVESESPLILDVELPKPTEENREQIITEQNSALPEGWHAEKVPEGWRVEKVADSCLAENVPNCCYTEQVREDEELKQLVRGEL